jgi:hypothetical protein
MSNGKSQTAVERLGNGAVKKTSERGGSLAGAAHLLKYNAGVRCEYKWPIDHATSSEYRLLSFPKDDFILFPVLYDHAEEQSCSFATNMRSSERAAHLPVPFCLILISVMMICFCCVLTSCVQSKFDVDGKTRWCVSPILWVSVGLFSQLGVGCARCVMKIFHYSQFPL